LVNHYSGETLALVLCPSREILLSPSGDLSFPPRRCGALPYLFAFFFLVLPFSFFLEMEKYGPPDLAFRWTLFFFSSVLSRRGRFFFPVHRDSSSIFFLLHFFFESALPFHCPFFWLRACFSCYALRGLLPIPISPMSTRSSDPPIIFIPEIGSIFPDSLVRWQKGLLGFGWLFVQTSIVVPLSGLS